MNNSYIIKRKLLQLGFFVIIILIASCSNDKRNQDSKDVAEERNEEKFDNRNQERDAQFLVDASEINVEGILLGKLAQQNGSVSHVKDLGKRMVESHTQSQRDLTELAKSKNITIPSAATNDVKDAHTNLKEKTGNDFDKAYADAMVDQHQDAIETYRMAITESSDEDIKNNGYP